MENPENLLINVCGNNVRTYSFKELFEENQDVNMILTQSSHSKEFCRVSK